MAGKLAGLWVEVKVGRWAGQKVAETVLKMVDEKDGQRVAMSVR